MSSLATVNLLRTNSVKFGSVPIKRIMRGSTLIWTASVFPYIRYDSASGKYYNVTGVSQNGTQYVQTELEPYYLVKMYGQYDYPLGVYASINTVIELWCTKLQDWGKYTISNAWSMNDSTGSCRIFAWYTNNTVCFDFGSDSYSNSNSKGGESYMVRLLFNSTDLLNGTSGDIYHMKVGNIDNRVKQIVYRNNTQVCNNQSNTLLSFYRGTDEEALLHLYHMNNNDDFTFYKVVIWQEGELVRNMYWKKDANDNLYLYDAVTDSAMTSTVSSGSLTYQTGKDTYTLHDDIGPVTDYYYADGTITVNGVTYERLVNSIDNTKIIKGIIISDQEQEQQEETPAPAQPTVEYDMRNDMFTFSCATPGALIFYTMGDVNPSENSATAIQYTEPVKWDELESINGNTTCRVQAYLNNQWSESLVFDLYDY